MCVCLFGSVRTRGVCVVRVGQSATRTRARVDARSVRDTCSMRACGPRAHKKRRSFAEPRLRESAMRAERICVRGACRYACIRVVLLYTLESYAALGLYVAADAYAAAGLIGGSVFFRFVVMSYCTSGAAASPPRGRSLRPHRHPHRRSSSVFSECTETSNVPARAAGGGFHKRE
jgi:hypothetical protein